MKIVLSILGIIALLVIIICGIALKKYLDFDKTMKKINQKQNEKDIDRLNLN